MWIPLGNQSSVTSQPRGWKVPRQLSLCQPENQGARENGWSDPARACGRAASVPCYSDSQSHHVARKPGEGHLTQPRNQGRLPEGGDHVQGRGVSQTMGVTRATKGIPRNGITGPGVWRSQHDGNLGLDRRQVARNLGASLDWWPTDLAWHQAAPQRPPFPELTQPLSTGAAA